MSRHKIDTVSFVKARKAQTTADLANGDIASLVTQLSSLQSQFATLSNNFTALQNAYNAHIHGYSDVDNTGATLNKSTGTPT